MKPYIALILFLHLSISLSAQDKFYYCKGEKVVLTEQPNKRVVIRKHKDATEPFDMVKSSATIVASDSIFDIHLIENDMETSKRALNSSQSFIVEESSYIDKYGVELLPNGYFYIKLKQLSDIETLRTVAKKYNLSIIEQNAFMPLWYTLRLNDNYNSNSIIDLANSIYIMEDVAACEPAFSYDCLDISYDPYVTKQWGLFNFQDAVISVNVSGAWSYATGRGVKIAFVDTGIDLNHRDLRENISLSYDCYRKSSPTGIYSSHGTHCAGIAAAQRNNGFDIAGVAPDAKIMAAGVLMDAPSQIQQFADGINWSWNNGADIISCSWHCNESEMIKDAIDNAINHGRDGKGCIIIKSAGNTSGPITFPGDYRKEIVVVGSISRSGQISQFSCFGDKILLCAPGESILSTVPEDGIAYKSGTSMACPHVSGVVALMLERNPSLTVHNVRQILAETAAKIGDMEYDATKEYGLWNAHYGYGLVKAVNAVKNTPLQQ